MTRPIDPITIDLRIPGRWAHPRDLIERLPDGCRLSGTSLVLPDAEPVEFRAVPPDDQFAHIFRTSCREPATTDELATVDDYRVNVILSGPGGSLDAARAMMRAASAILRAGGAGVFIDNSALAHGGQNWLEMTEDGGPDAVSFAFITIVHGRTEAWTMGMHVLGLRDVVMKPAEAEAKDFGIIDVIRYLARSDKPVEDGHLLADLSGPRYRAVAQGSDEKFKGGPMYNPFGRLKLVSFQDVAESN